MFNLQPILLLVVSALSVANTLPTFAAQNNQEPLWSKTYTVTNKTVAVPETVLAQAQKYRNSQTDLINAQLSNAGPNKQLLSVVVGTGTHNQPLLFFLKDGQTYKPILTTIGVGWHFAKSSHNGMHDLVVSQHTSAAEGELVLFQFDGSTLKPKEQVTFMFQSEDKCTYSKHAIDPESLKP